MVLPDCEEIMTKKSSFLRFDTIPACDGRTDGHLRSLLPALA